MKRSVFLWLVLIIVTITISVIYSVNKSSFNPNTKYSIGQSIDSINEVLVYYNGMVGHNEGRNIAPDGYNIGMKYQCVEFVKRYYYQYYHHKMPDSYGNAKDFYDSGIVDSSVNNKRGLRQFSNGSVSKPMVGDLVVFDGHPGNIYGHVAIICSVSDSSVCIIQQNPGPFASSRAMMSLQLADKKWTILDKRLLGWLRKDTVSQQTAIVN